MKKSVQFIVLAAFFICSIANAQSSNKITGNGNVVSQTRSTSDYDGVKVAGSFDVELVSGKEGNIILKGEENLLAVIKVEVVENILKVYVEKNTNIRSGIGKKIQITIPFEKISNLSLAGSGDIQSKDPIKNDKFAARLAGSGNLNLNVDSANFEVDLSGSGNALLKGNSDNFTVKLAGSGNIDALNLKSKKADIKISGSGNSKINCNESLIARVSGSGDVKYSGNPEKRDVKVSGSGNISKA